MEQILKNKEVKLKGLHSKKGKYIKNGINGFYTEINKREYNNIKGLKAEITQAEFNEMLEILPPLFILKNYVGFYMCEFLTFSSEGDLTTKFYKENDKYYAEVVDFKSEEIYKQFISEGGIY